MLGGLDYHHDNFLLQHKKLAPYHERHATYLKHSMEQRKGNLPYPIPTDEERQVQEYLHHEAFAYISRLGQFYAFAKALKLDACLSRVSELMLFRNKHTAHRSIDVPRKEDDPRTQEWHAMAFGFYHLTVGSFSVFQIHNHQHHVQFHMRDDHPVVMEQALDVLQKIHSVPT